MKKINLAISMSLLTLGGLALMSCSNNAITTSKTTTQKLELKEFKQSDVKGLSSLDYEFEKEYFYYDYNEKSLADTNRQGIETFKNKEDIVFDAITYEELIDIFESDGTYLILFGGSWCHNTRAAVPFITDYAKEYGITKIYNFDFYMDGANSNTHIRNTNPTDPAKATPGTNYNYMYGELVSKYLTNLTDYVEYKTGSNSSVNYTNSNKEVVNVAKVQVPFLFLYNKDNTIDNSGIENGGTKNTKGTFPIVYGFEEMVDLDKDGVYVKKSNVKTYITNEYKERLKVIFDYIKDNKIGLSNYDDSKYIKKFYNLKSGKEIFKDNDIINIKPITYRQLIWLLNQDKDSIIFLGGTWCPNTQATIKTTNDYAVKNKVVVFNFDTKLDSGYVKANWGYSTDLHIRDTQNPFVRLYTDLIEKYLTNIKTLYDVNLEASYAHIDYTNSDGEIVKVKKLQVPYLLSYNKNAKDEDGFIAPITSYYEEMLVLNDTSESYVYNDINYKSVKDNTYNVINRYLNLSSNLNAINI